MKVETSVTLSNDLLQTIDNLLGSYKSRSEFIEAALRAFIAQLIQEEQNARDLEIINESADRLNQEAMDVLAYQVTL
jgi:metal-responsive CopG/Arc/MetJ family transcriptional regulator